MKLLYKIQRFMYGRYGVDELYKFLFWLYITIFLLDLFVDFYFLVYVEFLLIITMIFRSLSKNTKKRYQENQWFLNLKQRFMKPLKNLKRNYKQRKDYVYKKCHKCKTTLRLPLPSERGIKHTRCPNCKKKISFLCLRKQKVEIILNK